MIQVVKNLYGWKAQNSKHSVCFVGIDASLSGTGLIALKENGQVFFKNEVGYSLPKGSSPWDRIDRVTKICNSIETLVDNFDGKIVLAHEGYALGSKGAQSFYIGELGGQVWRIYKKLLQSKKIAVIEIAPKSLKKFATGNGNSSKTKVAAHVASRWNEIFDNDNLTDAYALAQVGRAVSGILNMPKVHLAALEKVTCYVEI